MARLRCVTKTTVRWPCSFAAFRPAGGAFHHALESFALLRGQHGPDTFTGLLQFLPQLRINRRAQLANAFLTLPHDLADLFPLFGSEFQAAFEQLGKFAAQQAGRLGRGRRLAGRPQVWVGRNGQGIGIGRPAGASIAR